MLLKVILLSLLSLGAFATRRLPILPSSGCEVLDRLWRVAEECSIDRPGIGGVVDRLLGLIQCDNVQNFMSMATMKCWSENGSNSLPPMFLKGQTSQHPMKGVLLNKLVRAVSPPQ